jgi:hypothetical protein
VYGKSAIILTNVSISNSEIKLVSEIFIMQMYLYFGGKFITMGPIGFNELLILVFVLILLIIIPVIFIYKYGKQKGRLKELERQMQRAGNNFEG